MGPLKTILDLTKLALTCLKVVLPAWVIALEDAAAAHNHVDSHTRSQREPAQRQNFKILRNTSSNGSIQLEFINSFSNFKIFYSYTCI